MVASKCRLSLCISMTWFNLIHLARLTGMLSIAGFGSSGSDIEDSINKKNIQRKDVWVPIKDKHTEFDQEYKNGVWNESVWDTSFPSGFSQSYAIPIERMRLSVLAGVYFQMYPRDSCTSTMLDVGCGSGLMANYLMPGQVSRYTGMYGLYLF